jgi:hypothetical protein
MKFVYYKFQKTITKDSIDMVKYHDAPGNVLRAK